MDMATWKKKIDAHGGMEAIAEMRFDNGRTFYKAANVSNASRITMDYDNQCWEIRDSLKGFEINNVKKFVTAVEDNGCLTCIVFLDNPNDVMDGTF